MIFDNNSNKNFLVTKRIQLVRVVILALSFVLLSALAYYQIFFRSRYVILARKNRLRSIRMEAPRGSIYDHNGNPLALNVIMFDIKCYPNILLQDDNMKRIAEALTRCGIVTTEKILDEKLRKQYTTPYSAITVAKNLTFAHVAEIISDENINSLVFPTRSWKRTYPSGKYTVHVVGYVGEISDKELEKRQGTNYHGGDTVGKNGIEYVYEDDLFGEPGEELIEVDAKGRKVKDVVYNEPVKGDDIFLTIDLEAQKYAAELLGDFRGAVVVMDVRDGSILVLYSSPSYDPNSLTWGITHEDWLAMSDHRERPMMNRAISGAYPPASTFKAIMGSALLEKNVANMYSQVYCSGYYELGGTKFRCWRHSGHGTENIFRALSDSCDVYFYTLAHRAGINALTDVAEKFGVGKKTGIDLTSESSGTLPTPKWKKHRLKVGWYGGDTVNFSIGQGYVLMTPLQVLRAYAAIANGGKLVTPYIRQGKVKTAKALGISHLTLETIKKGLYAVTHGGTGTRASAFGVDVSGKTGTAQNSQGADHAWFVGFAPSGQPKYAAVVIAEAGEHGSSVCGPIVGKILSYLITGKKH
ncbi:MAG: penicillin-binding protein 2 [Synergistaceae bacterium]|nr:penicillin-binding protein 2 [Synergistaceae bacterium]